MNCPRCGKDNVDPVYPHTCTPLALKLADWLERRTMKMLQDRQAAEELRRLHAENEARRESLKTEELISFRRQMQGYAAQDEKDEALLRQALEALEIGRDYAFETAEQFHIEMRGYMQQRHDAMDADVKRIDVTIAAIRTRLSPTANLTRGS